MAEPSRDCYRLYLLSDRREWNAEARSYSGSVQSWLGIMPLAGENEAPKQMRLEGLEE